VEKFICLFSAMDLAVQVRTEKGKELKSLRREDLVPCIVYGKYIDAPVNLTCQKQDFLKIYKSAGYSMPVTLKGDGVDQLVLIHDIQVDPVTDYVLHVDFLTLKKWQKVETEVHVIMEGLAPIEKLGLGKVQLVKSSIAIEALPKDLPHDIKVDVSKLEDIHDVIFVKDLNVGSGVTIIDDVEQAVITVMSLSADVEEEEEVTTDIVEESIDTDKKEAKSE